MTPWRSRSRPRSSIWSDGRTVGNAMEFVRPLSTVSPYAYNRPKAATGAAGSKCPQTRHWESQYKQMAARTKERSDHPEGREKPLCVTS